MKEHTRVVKLEFTCISKMSDAASDSLISTKEDAIEAIKKMLNNLSVDDASVTIQDFVMDEV